jgi:hypothetical protein
MDAEVRLTLIATLRGYAARTPRRFDPPGCGYCGDTSGYVHGSLCQGCADRLARLSALPSSPAADVQCSGGFTPLKFINQDPRLVRQSDLRRGRRIEKLPFDDDAA